jgi:hypothetical protein
MTQEFAKRNVIHMGKTHPIHYTDIVICGINYCNEYEYDS